MEDQPNPAPTKSKRKSAAGRQLIRWDFEKDQHLLLCLEYEAHRAGLQLPWDEAVQHIKQGATGQAVIQHLMKVRKFRVEKGQSVPPEPSKRRTNKTATGATNRKRKAMDDDEDDDDNDVPFKGSSNRMVFDPIKRKPIFTLRSKSPLSGGPVTSTSPTQPKRARKTTRARSSRTKVKPEKAENLDINDPDVAAEVDSEEEWVPGNNAGQQKRKRARPSKTSDQKDALESDTLSRTDRLRALEDVDYKELELEEDLGVKYDHAHGSGGFGQVNDFDQTSQSDPLAFGRSFQANGVHDAEFGNASNALAGISNMAANSIANISDHNAAFGNSNNTNMGLLSSSFGNHASIPTSYLSNPPATPMSNLTLGPASEPRFPGYGGNYTYSPRQLNQSMSSGLQHVHNIPGFGMPSYYPAQNNHMAQMAQPADFGGFGMGSNRFAGAPHQPQYQQQQQQSALMTPFNSSPEIVSADHRFVQNSPQMQHGKKSTPMSQLPMTPALSMPTSQSGSINHNTPSDEMSIPLESFFNMTDDDDDDAAAYNYCNNAISNEHVKDEYSSPYGDSMPLMGL